MSSIVIILGVLSTIVSSQSFRECADYEECRGLARIKKDQIVCSGYSGCLNVSSLISGNKRIDGEISCSGSYSCAAVDKMKSTGDINCGGYYSCRKLVWDESSNTVTAKNINCLGYGSCMSYAWDITGYPNPKAEYMARTAINCYATESCYSSVLSSNREIHCSGEESCAGRTLNNHQAVLDAPRVNCDGRRSCQEANITEPTALSCLGFESCMDSIIAGVSNGGTTVLLYGEESATGATLDNVGTINAYGHRSLTGATVLTGSVSIINIKAFGAAAMNRATLDCSSGTTCNLVCKGNGCWGLTYQCETGATCNITPAGCLSDNSVNDVNGIRCPTFTTTSATNTDVVFSLDIEEEDTELQKSEDIAPFGSFQIEPYRLYCNKERECKRQIIRNETIFCSAKSACINADIYDTGAGIICRGENSCNGGKLITERGGIDCWGANSCIGAEWSSPGNGDSYAMTCYGANSCQNTTFLSDPSLNNDNSEIICAGDNSCSATTIIKPYNDIRCEGRQSCYTSYLEQTKFSSIICTGLSSCEKAEMKTVSGSFHCEASYSCYEATIELIKKNQNVNALGVYIGGYYGAAMATIYGPKVQGKGYMSMTYATIDSINEIEIQVQASGHFAGYGATVICRSGVTCLLDCTSSGCSDLDYICLSGATACNISPSGCDGSRAKSDGVDCPNLLTNIASDKELDQYLEQKKLDRENDEIYQMLRNNNNQENDIRLMELMERQQEERELLVDNVALLTENNYMNKNKEILIFAIIGAVFVMSCLRYLIWNYYKSGDYESLK